MLSSMAITPLYTPVELDAEIAQAKRDLSAARRALSHASGEGASRRQTQREQVESLQRHLEWLQAQRVSAAVGSGVQFVTGRIPRG